MAKLDIELLFVIPKREVFATGIVVEPRLYSDTNAEGEYVFTPLRWVAVKGANNDWALYYHRATYDVDYVKRHGQKIITKEVIVELVPCTDEVYARYRH